MSLAGIQALSSSVPSGQVWGGGERTSDGEYGQSPWYAVDIEDTGSARAAFISGSQGDRVMQILSRICVALVAVALSACETTLKPVPDGYTGSTATVKDSMRVSPGDSCGDFFFLNEYAGKSTDNALQASGRDNAGSGLIIRVVHDFSRQVPTRSAAFFIVGRTHCAAPIQEMTGTVRLVGGNVEFTPLEGRTYVIKGELTPDHSAVWIEDEKTGAQVGNKLLINGPAKAGFFGVTGKVLEIPPP